MKHLIFIIFLLIFSGCGIVHYLSLTERHDESLAEANIYLTQIGIDTNLSYQISKKSLDSLGNPKFALNLYKLETGAKPSPVQVRMYDNEGRFLYGWEQCFGPLHKFDILDSIPFKHVNYLPVNLNLTLKTDISLFQVNEDQHNALIKKGQDFDYVIIVFWAKWAGWYSKNTLHLIKDYVDKYPNKKILFIKLNTANGYSME